MNQIAANLDNITTYIRSHPSKAQLVAVSKKQDTTKIRAALNCGQRVFGENQVQEALEKWPGLREEYPDIQLHLIGHLQTNKVRHAISTFDIIESLDREKLATACRKQIDKTNKNVEFYIQVNIAQEPQKGGVIPNQADQLIKYCTGLDLKVTGIMCIPPASKDPKPYFLKMNKIAKDNGLTNISMGMSNDYKVALECGSTHVRIGTAIFGKR